MVMIVTMMVVVHNDDWSGLVIMIMVLQLFMIVMVRR